ncbi:hypothetical protein WN51_04951 [Melipona quadrifasciata]|uniref:Uncharacterized protein n=1 Tax=Melipona quadrifasciata TaxID=166423 RepID=A0A0M8ZUB6_9HYME|nr:hypothetical protein WN51_04951 [Melipona quadrifasciata]
MQIQYFTNIETDNRYPECYLITVTTKKTLHNAILWKKIKLLNKISLKTQQTDTQDTFRHIDIIPTNSKEKESDELLWTIWSLVMVRNQLPAQVVGIDLYHIGTILEYFDDYRLTLLLNFHSERRNEGPASKLTCRHQALHLNHSATQLLSTSADANAVFIFVVTQYDMNLICIDVDAIAFIVYMLLKCDILSTRIRCDNKRCVHVIFSEPGKRENKVVAFTMIDTPVDEQFLTMTNSLVTKKFVKVSNFVIVQLRDQALREFFITESDFSGGNPENRAATSSDTTLVQRKLAIEYFDTVVLSTNAFICLFILIFFGQPKLVHTHIDIIPKSSKRKQRIIVYTVWSLVMVRNQLPAQVNFLMSRDFWSQRCRMINVLHPNRCLENESCNNEEFCFLYIKVGKSERISEKEIPERQKQS